VRTTRTAAVALLALVALGQHPSAQSLTFSLFERYLESLRVESGIPGLSAAIVQSGRVAWDAGFGYQDVEGLRRASGDTPYPIADLSQTVASTLLLHRCVDSGRLEVSDRVRRWVARYPDESTTVSQLLRHLSASGSFKYDANRFADLTGVVEQCTSAGFGRYGRELVDEIFDPLSMRDSVPGQDLGNSSSLNRSLYDSGELADYVAVLGRLAVPYRVDSSRKATRSSYPALSLTASTGIVSTARDLAQFDAHLGLLVTAQTLKEAWSTSGSTPTGLGWFVQKYNGETLVWHFGLAENAYSSLVLKVPGRGLTLVLLANSDGLSSPYPLAQGDVTTSLFAKLFLRLFLV
jgi:CubicO group peptidase (beta-lactamase class C family)